MPQDFHIFLYFRLLSCLHNSIQASDYYLKCWTFNLLYQLSMRIMWSPQGWVVLWVKTTQQQMEIGQHPESYSTHNTRCARSVMFAAISSADSARFCSSMFQNQCTLKENKITNAIKQLKYLWCLWFIWNYAFPWRLKLQTASVREFGWCTWAPTMPLPP